MNGMVEKGKEEKHAEQMQFATFKQFCESTTASKSKSIKEANEAIEALTGDIEKYEADAQAKSKAGTKFDSDVSGWQGELSAATDVRKTEAADYETTYQDYTESITALEEGLATLKKEDHVTKGAGAAALVQLSSAALVPPEAQRAIRSFL